MSESKEKCKIFADNDPELGNFIEGYDSRKDFNARNGCILIFGIALVLFGIIIFITIVGESVNEPHSAKRFVSGLFALLFMGGIGAIAMSIVLGPWSKPCQVLVYEKGFIWRKINRAGEEKSSKKVMFDDVSYIHYTKEYRSNAHLFNINTGTYLKFKVYGKKGATLLRKEGNNRRALEDPEEGGWMYYAMDAIEAQWTKSELPRLMEKWEQKGELYFVNSDGPSVTLDKEGIKTNRASVSWKTMKFKIGSDSYLRIDNSLREKKFLSSSDIEINLNTLNNSSLFLAAFRFLAQQGTISTN